MNDFLKDEIELIEIYALLLFFSNQQPFVLQTNLPFLETKYQTAPLYHLILESTRQSNDQSEKNKRYCE